MTYDPSKVQDFVAEVSGSAPLLYAFMLTHAAATFPFAEAARLHHRFGQMTTWERVNVLYGLRDKLAKWIDWLAAAATAEARRQDDEAERVGRVVDAEICPGCEAIERWRLSQRVGVRQETPVVEHVAGCMRRA